MPEHAEILAGTLGWDEWFEVYAAVRNLEQLTWGAPDDPATPVTDSDEEYLTRLIDSTLHGATVCARVALYGTSRRRVRDLIRRQWQRVRPIDDQKLVEQVLENRSPLR